MIECTKTEVIALRSNAQIDKKCGRTFSPSRLYQATVFAPKKDFKSFCLPVGQTMIGTACLPLSLCDDKMNILLPK